MLAGHKGHILQPFNGKIINKVASLEELAGQVLFKYANINLKPSI